MLSDSFRSLLPEHRRHAPDDSPDAGRALPERPSLPHQVHHPVEHQQDAVVRLCCRHFEEAAALRQSQQPALLAGDPTAMLQVPLVRHDDHRAGRRFPAAPDELQLLPHCLKAAAVANVIDQDHAVRPLQLLLADPAAFLLYLRGKIWLQTTDSDFTHNLRRIFSLGFLL